jgi:hypothetical protein
MDEGGGRIGSPALADALPRYLGAEALRSQLLPYQQLRRVAEVIPAVGCSGFRKSLVNARPPLASAGQVGRQRGYFKLIK